MRPTDRRTFLKSLGGLVVATAAGPILLEGFAPRAFAASALDPLAATLPPGTPICVLLTLDGGNDPLSTLVPVTDPWYYDTTYGHGALAFSAAETLGLTASPYRLHPNLPWLADRWNATGDVAFVVGAGELDHGNFSHFDSMKYWQTADTTLLEPLGWMGRYNDLVRPGNPLAAVSVDDLRLEVIGSTGPALVLHDTSLFSYSIPWQDAAHFRSSLDTMATSTLPGPVGAAAALIATTFDVSQQVTDASDSSITGGGPYSAITDKLLQCALLIRAGIPCQTYSAAYGPFDSHGGQPAMHGDRMTELNEGLATFFGALEGHSREHDVFVMIASEFGRQITANVDSGTDHGQAGVSIFVGGGVQGGVYGQAPTLDPGGPTRPNRINDSMVPNLDFRSIHAMAMNRLSGDPGVADAVLRGPYEDLGVFTAPNQAPTATFTSSTKGLSVKLDAGGSGDPDGSIAAYDWHFGDGQIGHGSRVRHTYAVAGRYRVGLTVTDDRGATASTTSKISL